MASTPIFYKNNQKLKVLLLKLSGLA